MVLNLAGVLKFSQQRRFLATEECNARELIIDDDIDGWEGIDS
jgi:hypothetical protein